MLIPYRSLADPEVQGEGSIDPLGLAALADHLADWILPGLTARMWRPRFLTAIAVASVTVEPFGEELAKDGVTPPWLVFEWYYVEAMARLNDADGNQLRRIPGIEKGRQALRDGVPLSADRYLKTPKVFGFHGVYKRLARHVDVVDDDLALGENGHRLLRLWEAEQGMQGFSGPDRPEGEAARICRALRDAIGDALREGQAQRGGSWLGASFFVCHLVPHRPGPREAAFLWELLVAASAAPRGEVFDLLRRPEVRREFLEVGSERTLLANLWRGGQWLPFDESRSRKAPHGLLTYDRLTMTEIHLLLSPDDLSREIRESDRSGS